MIVLDGSAETTTATDSDRWLEEHGVDPTLSTLRMRNSERQYRVRLSYHADQGFHQRSDRASRSDSPSNGYSRRRSPCCRSRGGKHHRKIIADPLTGLPVLSAGADAPVLSSKEVEEILANFP